MASRPSGFLGILGVKHETSSACVIVYEKDQLKQ